MRKSNTEKNHFKRVVLTAVLLAGTSTMAFQGITQVAVAAEYNKTTAVPTTYADYTQQPQKTQENAPADYHKTDYTIGQINLAYYKNQKPTEKDITKEAAAEIGAQALWSVFGENLEGQKIEMGYQSANESFPRSRWYADVIINDVRSYSFAVDSVTGELFSVVRDRTLKEKVSVAYDQALAKNPQEYIALAEKTAEKLNIVHGAVVTAEYDGQGYSSNDPIIQLVVRGKNGEVAQLSFSRYDKSLRSISYNAEYKYILELMNKMEQSENKVPTLESN